MKKIPEVIKAPTKQPLEKQVEARLSNKIKTIGGHTWKFASPNSRGVSDRIVIINGRVIFVEVKRDGGKMTPLQEKFRRTVLDNRGEFTCVTGYTGVDNFVDNLLKQVKSHSFERFTD